MKSIISTVSRRPGNQRTSSDTVSLDSAVLDLGGRTLSRENLGSLSPFLTVPAGQTRTIRNGVIDLRGDEWRPSVHGTSSQLTRGINVFGTLITEDLTIRNGLPQDVAPFAANSTLIRNWEHHGTYDYSYYEADKVTVKDGLINVTWLNSNVSAYEGKTVRYLTKGIFTEMYVYDGGGWYLAPQTDMVWIFNGGTMICRSGTRIENAGYTGIRCGGGGTLQADGLTCQDAFRGINNADNADITIENSNFYDSGMFLAGGAGPSGANAVIRNVLVEQTDRLAHYDQIVGKLEDFDSASFTNFTISLANELTDYSFAVRNTPIVTFDNVDIPSWISTRNIDNWTIANSILGPTGTAKSSVLYQLAADSVVTISNTTFRGVNNTPLIYASAPTTPPVATNVTINGGYDLYRPTT